MVQNFLCWYNFRSTNFWVQRNFESTKFWVQRSFGSKENLIQKMLGKKELKPAKKLVQKVWSKWDQTAEIILIWTDVARTNVEGLMSLWRLASVKDDPRNLPLKFNQNWVSNCWDNSGMDKCCKDKCFLDKCHCEGWYLLKMV